MGKVHISKVQRRVTIPKGMPGFLLGPAKEPGKQEVVFELGSANSVTMTVPAEYITGYKDGPRPVSLPG